MFLRPFKRFGSVDSTHTAQRRRKPKRLLECLRIEALEARQLLSITTATGTTVAPIEAASFSGPLATFTSPDDGPFSATIDWGDGSSLTTVSGSSISGGPSPAAFTVNGTHTYAEDGSDPVSVVITDTSDAKTGTATGTANVAEGNSGSAAGNTINTTEGTAITGFQVATFVDPGSPDPASDFMATIDWGDGATTSGTVTGSAGSYTVLGDHTYTDELNGGYVVTVTEPSANFTFTPVGNSVAVAEADTLTPDATPQTLTGTEGISASGNVAVFTDTYTANVASDFSSTIDWGDGSPPTAGTVAISGGNITVSGSHTYAEDGAYMVTTSIADKAPGTATATATGTANVHEASFVLTGAAPITATEGSALNNVVLATFSDPGSPDAASDFSAIIDWGDGTADTVSPTGVTGSGNFTVAGSHTYLDEFSGNINVTVTEGNFTIGPNPDAITVKDADMLVPPAGTTITATEGTTFTGAALAVFTNTGYPANAASDFNATINWGDGSTLTVAATGGSGTPLTVSANHLYADEGTFTATVTLHDISGTANASVTDTAVVSEADSLAAFATPATVGGTEGTAVSGTVAVFTNAGYPANAAGDFTATVDWGDGTITTGSVSGGSGTDLTVSGSHTYAQDGAYTVTTTIADDAPGTATAVATATANIAESSDLTLFPGAVSATEGTTFNGAVAAISDLLSTDPSTDYTATINWGDGSAPTAGIVSGSSGFYPITGSHEYLDEGNYTITVTAIETTAAPPATVSTTFATTVAEADVLTPIAASASAIEGTTFTGTVATFTNTGYPANPTSDFTAKINWGDGHTSAGTVSGTGNGTLTVSGSNIYADEGSNPLTVTLVDDAPGTARATATGTATVAEGDVLAAVAATVSATEGVAFTGAVATFTNTGYPANPPSDFTATITWGNGDTSVGTVSGTGNGTLTVSGSQLYADEGSYALSVTLADDAPGTAKATASGTATVAEHDVLAPVLTPVHLLATEGTSFSGTVATFTNTGYPANPASDFTATITWGDGHTSVGVVSGSGNGTLTVSGSNLYADEGAYTLSITLNDDAPGTASGTATGAATVQEADVLAATGPATVSAVERSNFTGVIATFSDIGYPANTASDFTATIDWGDGATTAGTVAGLGNGTFTVSGSHTYAEEGSYPLKVTLTDDAPGTASATATGSAMVALPAGVGFLAGVPGDDTPQTFVQNLYRELLGRNGSSTDIAAWVSYLQGNDNALGRATVIADFMNSPEYKAHYITTVYELFLERAPDQDGLNFWVNKMGSPGAPGQNTGSADEKYIIAAFLSSDEYYFKAGNTPQGWINAVYEDLLGRPPQASDTAFWMNELLVRGSNDRDGIVRDLLTSPEAAHDLLNGFYPAPGGTANTPLATPGTTAGAGMDDLGLLTGGGWENLYLEGPYDSSPEGNDAFFAALASGGSWDDTQLLILNTPQFYSNTNTPVTKDLNS